MSRSISTEDRISALPDPIIWHILSFVPTKTAAITSILSKRWNPLWLSVLILHFEDETFQNMESFSHFMSSVFLLRDITLPIRSFHLNRSKRYGIETQNINRFVHAIAQRGIENLNLELSGSITLPRSVFSCRTLVVLHLQWITVKDLSQLVLLSGCPILEELHAESLIVRNKEWLVSLNFVRQKFPSLPKLITANITKSSHSLALFLALLCRAKSQLLRAELDFENEEEFEEVVDNWVYPTIIPDCLSTQLKTCLLKGYECTDRELQFAKYIMQNSEVLKTMSIKSASSIDTNTKHQIWMKLASCTRASSTCKLLFD
ncbi:putative F-box domain, FBD domain, leucine-rich repeat domain, L domain-containing protein [Medicago truncatula]|uniref:Putative F-box domain, FBD domain, leucine-rich repeat domain, L domain-containing protein n=1 Tax=Medicago truncatula TaxID=3880 RepID=A0A396GXY5_MEDTR|nr:putative F-box domain, FBD domain, leucine-rich repeat domain, L domain-containing protein [Medicago truncatula]RHN45874.1 putative F-box domain, FBD domain, leucine-rich repeat domain, L domain-containing protein [Medicago truncatula]